MHSSHNKVQVSVKNKTILLNCLTLLEPIHEVFDLQNSRNILPLIPFSKIKVLTLYKRQELD